MTLTPESVYSDAQKAAQEASELASTLPYLADATEAAELLQDVQARLRELEKLRDGVIKPLNEAKRKIDALFKPALSRYEGLKGELKNYIAARLREQRALQHEALAKGDVQAAIAVQPPAVATRTVLRWRIVGEVPREYLTVDTKKVEEAVRAGRAVPGVETYYEETVIAR